MATPSVSGAQSLARVGHVAEVDNASPRAGAQCGEQHGPVRVADLARVERVAHILHPVQAQTAPHTVTNQLHR